MTERDERYRHPDKAEERYQEAGIEKADLPGHFVQG